MELWTIGKGGGGDSPPFSFELPRLYLMSPVFIVQYLDLSLSLEFLTKGGLKWTPPFGSFKNERNEMDPLNES